MRKVGEQERVLRAAPASFSLYLSVSNVCKNCSTSQYSSCCRVSVLLVLSRAARPPRAKTSFPTVSCTASKHLPCNGHHPPHDPPVMPPRNAVSPMQRCCCARFCASAAAFCPPQLFCSRSRLVGCADEFFALFPSSASVQQLPLGGL